MVVAVLFVLGMVAVFIIKRFYLFWGGNRGNMGEYISDYLEKIINDKNISRQGREMLILLKSLDNKGKNRIRVTLRELLFKLDTQNRERVCNTLRELEAKGYIAIDKSVGKVNTYTFLKEYLVRVGTSCEEGIIGIDKGSKENLPGHKSSRGENLLSSEKSRGGNVLSSENSSTESLHGYIYARQENGTTCKSTEKESLCASESIMEESLSGYEGGRKEYILPNEKTSKEILPTSVKGSGESLPGYYLYNIDNNYINNNINDLFINIFNHWNKQSISNNSDLDLRIKDSINMALSKYSFESIIKAISNYSEVYHSEYFYNIKWSLNSFLTNSKAIDKFQDNGQMWQQYSESKYSKESISYGGCKSSDDKYGDKRYFSDDVLDKYKYIDV